MARRWERLVRQSRLAIADRWERLRGTRDPRVPPRRLNFNQIELPLDPDRYTEAFARDIRKVQRFLEGRGLLREDTRILDYGCGLGRLAYVVAPQIGESGSYLGVDIARSAIQFLDDAYRDAPNVRFAHLPLDVDHYVKGLRGEPKGETAAEAVSIAAPDESFDLQVSLSVFTHMVEPEIVGTLREIRRTLAPGGTSVNSWLIVDTQARRAVAAGRADRVLPYERDGLLYNDPDNLLSCTAYRPDRVEAMYRAAGHEIVEILPGSWSGSGRDNDVIYQDVVLSRAGRPPETSPTH